MEETLRCEGKKIDCVHLNTKKTCCTYMNAIKTDLMSQTKSSRKLCWKKIYYIRRAYIFIHTAHIRYSILFTLFLFQLLFLYFTFLFSLFHFFLSRFEYSLLLMFLYGCLFLTAVLHKQTQSNCCCYRYKLKLVFYSPLFSETSGLK